MTEAQLHKAVAAYLRLALKPPVLWTTFPAGGGGKARGGQLKAMGLRAGFPDILVMGPANNGIRVIGLELKTRTGRQSPAQMDMLTAFVEAGAWYAVCRSVEEVQAELDLCDFYLHARVA